MKDKITINVTREDLRRLNELQALFPFARTHALVQLAFRIGLDAGPDRLIKQLNLKRPRSVTT